MQQNLIDRVLSGDLDAYEVVVRQFQAILLGYAAHRLPDIDTAQEVVQLTFIRAYQQLSEYQPERDFGVWLCVICKHFILTELERQRRDSRNLEKFSHTLRLRISEVMAGVGDEGQGSRSDGQHDGRDRQRHGQWLHPLQPRSPRDPRGRRPQAPGTPCLPHGGQQTNTVVESLALHSPVVWRGARAVRTRHGDVFCDGDWLTKTSHAKAQRRKGKTNQSLDTHMNWHYAPRRIVYSATFAIVLMLPSLCVSAPLREQFLNEYCIKCHGPDKQSGDRRFDAFSNEIQTPDEALLWQEILDQLNLGEMPPKKEKQPTKTELLAAVDAITQSLADATQRFKGAGFLPFVDC